MLSGDEGAGFDLFDIAVEKDKQVSMFSGLLYAS